MPHQGGFVTFQTLVALVSQTDRYGLLLQTGPELTQVTQLAHHRIVQNSWPAYYVRLLRRFSATYSHCLACCHRSEGATSTGSPSRCLGSKCPRLVDSSQGYLYADEIHLRAYGVASFQMALVSCHSHDSASS